MENYSGDRREAARYPLQMRLRYQVTEGTHPVWRGTGMTVDISRAGIRFRTGRDLPVFAHLEVAIEWPVRFGGMYPIELRVTGTVVRSDDDGVVVVMSSREFQVMPEKGVTELERAQSWSARCRHRGEDEAVAAVSASA